MTISENTNNSITYRFNGLALNPTTRELIDENGRIPIEKKVLSLLIYLIENRDRAISKDELQEAIWPTTIVTEAALTRAIMKARRAVNDSADMQQVIHTLHGEGYRFVADLDNPSDPDSEPVLPPIPEPPDLATSPAPAIAVIGTMLLLVAVILVMQNQRPEPGPDTSPAREAMIAVLPFENLSPDPDHAYFAEGIHEEVLNQISRGTSMQVLARASVKQYDNPDQSIPVIAKTLGVKNILAGSIRYSGNKVRVATELIDGQTGISLWSNNYDRELGDTFAIQSDIATQIALALNAEISEMEVITSTRTNPKAYREYLMARSFRDRTFETGWDPVLKHVNQSLEHDPDFVPALWLLHNAYQNRIIGDTHAAAYRGMLNTTRRATVSDPQHPLTLALIAKDAAYGWKWREAVSAWDKAILADMENPVVRGDAALLNLTVGNIDRASEIIEYALDANPRHDWLHYALLHMHRANSDDAAFLETADLILSIGSNRAFPASFSVALYYLERGDAERVREYSETMARMTGGRLQGVADLLVAITQGVDVSPMQVQAFINANPPTNNYKWMTTQIYLAMDAPAYALATLADIANSRALFSVIKIITDPAFDPIRETPEYLAFLAAVKLDEAL